MIKSGQAYHAAITGDARRVLLRAVIDIISPDIVFQAGGTSGQIPWSNLEQIHDKVFDNPTKYATLERDRWILDGTWVPLPDSPSQAKGQMGYIGNVLSGEDGTFATPPWVELRFSGVSVLQACSVYFPGNAYDGSTAIPSTLRSRSSRAARRTTPAHTPETRRIMWPLRASQSTTPTPSG